MRKAFSLVELSIALVIIGLIVGGIIAGRGMIRSGELKSVAADFNRYQSAILAFKDKYDALPGDMPDATSYWAALDGSTGLTAGCYTASSTGTATCNGDGDDTVDYDGSRLYSEPARAWQHLSNAGLIEGKFTGANGSCVLGTTCPKSKIDATGFSFIFIPTSGTFSNELFSAGFSSNHLTFGKVSNFTRSPALTPSEASAIDTKMDDGKPDNGNMQTNANSSPNCITGAYPDAMYATGLSSLACGLHLRVY